MRSLGRSRSRGRSGLEDALARLLPPGGIALSDAARRTYERDGLDVAGDWPLAVVFPESSEHVSGIVRECLRRGVPMVPRGAGTCRTGGAMPLGGSIVVSTTRMRRILDFDAVAGTIRVEAGVRNMAISDHVSESGWTYAPDPSSRRTCTIGGNIATNSGGAGALRHGVTVNHLASVTVVLPEGDTATFGSAALDAGGAEIAALLCGAEGQLGIVTEATLRLTPRPPATRSLLIACDTAEAALDRAQGIMGAGIVPLQMDIMDEAAVALCEAFSPSGYPERAVLLVQLAGMAEELAETVDRILGETTVSAIAASSEAEKGLWRGRDSYYGAAMRKGPFLALDCAVPLGDLAAALTMARKLAASHGLDCATFVHATDGTIHTFIFHEGDQTGRSRANALGDTIRVACARMGGTISSEYGIGLEKRCLMSAQFTAEELAMQRRVVDVFQGAGNFNPGKVLPPLAEAAE